MDHIPFAHQAGPLTIETRYGLMQIPAGESDMIGRFLTRYGEWGWNEAVFVASVVEDGARVLDAGAFIGTFGLGLALLRPLQNLCCVEANPAIVPFLVQNITALARCPSAVVEGMLAGPGAQPRAGRGEPDNLGATSFRPIDESGVSVPAPARAMTLGDLRAAHGDFDLIKLDVEGMEREVLEADAEHLSRGHVTLWIECNEDARSLDVAGLLLSWTLDLFYVAWPSYNPGNFQAHPEPVYPFAFEAALLAAPRAAPQLGTELRAQGCMLKPVRSIDDLRLALWLTPRWGEAAWERAADRGELAALAGRALRGESFPDFLRPGAGSPVPLLERANAAEAAAWRLTQAERELARTASRALDHLAAAGAWRERAASLEQELAALRSSTEAAIQSGQARAHAAEQALAITRASNSWRLTAPLRALQRRLKS